VTAVKRDWRDARVDEKTRALLEWTERLTRDPRQMRREHVEGLRAAGWTDREILDAAQIVAYFNYINRLADGLGVDLEPDMPPAGGA